MQELNLNYQKMAGMGMKVPYILSMLAYSEFVSDRPIYSFKTFQNDKLGKKQHQQISW